MNATMGAAGTAVPASRALLAARTAMVCALVALMFSPPVTNLLQLVLVVLFIASAELRGRLARACRQPLVLGALAFWLVVTLGVTYSAGGWQLAANMWSGWRKILLLPLAVALFDEPRWKLRLVHAFVAVAVVAALASFAGLWLQVRFPVPDSKLGIVVRNHATQGMLFAVAAFGAALLAAYGPGLAARQRALLGAGAVLLVANVVLVTPGRSGYVVLLACSAALVLGWGYVRRRGWLLSVGGTVAALAVISLALSASPTARLRIDQGVAELRGYGQASTLTSMGVRVHFWRNTIEMVHQRPVLGWGTGSFETVYGLQVAGRTGVAGIVTSDPHNQYMNIAAEHGLVGLAVFLAFLLAALRQRPGRVFAVLGLGMLAGWCATSLASSHFSTFSEGSFAYIWLGAMLARETGPPSDG